MLVAPLSKEAKAFTSSVPWLMRTEYISSERHVYGRKLESRYHPVKCRSGQKEEAMQKLIDLTEEDQIKHIENSFESVKKALLSNIKHPRKPELEALEMFPIFPDFEFWPNPYLLTTYDEDPFGEKRMVICFLYRKMNQIIICSWKSLC